MLNFILTDEQEEDLKDHPCHKEHDRGDLLWYLRVIFLHPHSHS